MRKSTENKEIIIISVNYGNMMYFIWIVTPNSQVVTEPIYLHEEGCI